MNNLLLITLAISSILLVWVIILTFLSLSSFRHYKKLVKSAEGLDLVGILEEHFRAVSRLDKITGDIKSEIQDIRRADLGHLQRVGLVRFNPYGDTGGNQSFVLGLLDDQGKGVVVSSLHGRDSTRVYCKPVKNWSEDGFEFSTEEKQAIKEAKR